jgi:hypothetical protein
MHRVTEAHPSPDQREQMTTIEVEVHGRWDALALSELLAPFHSFLVQHGPERWVVHARAPSGRDGPLSDALEALDDWGAERHPSTARCRVGGRPYRLQERRAA